MTISRDFMIDQSQTEKPTAAGVIKKFDQV